MPAARAVGFGQHTRELVAAVARHEIGSPQLTLENGADLPQDAVACRMAEPVVDLVQVIDVDDDEREMQGIAPRALELVAQPPVERIERRAAGHLVGRSRADLPAI